MVTRKGFEPLPFRTGALNQRLRPLGHLALSFLLSFHSFLFSKSTRLLLFSSSIFNSLNFWLSTSLSINKTKFTIWYLNPDKMQDHVRLTPFVSSWSLVSDCREFFLLHLFSSFFLLFWKRRVWKRRRIVCLKNFYCLLTGTFWFTFT